MSLDTFKVNISSYKSNLTQLKDNLIRVVENTQDHKELNRKFMALASKDPDNIDLFQTLMLMQDISSTSQKNFKSSMIDAINTLINTKMDSYNQLEDLYSRLRALETNQGKQLKIPFFGTVSLKDTLLYFTMTFVILVTSYINEPDATKKAVDKVGTTVQETIGVK